MAILKKEKIAAGLDIGSYSVKAVEVLRRGEEFTLSGLGFERVSSSEKAAGAPERSAIIEAIKKLLANSKISSKNFGISISGPSVIVRYILLPSMTEEELESSLSYEAEKHIPFKMHQMQLDYKILATGLEGNKMRVLLVGAKKELVENVLSILDELGISAAFIDVDGFCLINALEFAAPLDGKSRICTILNVGHQFTNISVANDYLPYFTRDVAVGARDIMAATRGNVDIPFEAIEALAKPVVERLIGELRASFDYCESQYQTEKGIDKIFLSGGGAKFAGFDKYLENSLGVSVALWNPLANLAIPAELKEYAQGISQHMAVAAGLAIRGLSLHYI